MTKTIIGVFDDRANVEEAMKRLKDKGLNPKDISIVMKDRREAEDISDDTGADVAGGAVSGATTGAVLGGIAGLIASFALPGLGAFFIGGPIASALGLGGAAASTVSGAATGAVAGGLLGALMGLGLSEDEAEHYESRVKEGAILLAVPVISNQETFVQTIFNETDATDVKTISQPEEGIQKTQTKRTFADKDTQSERQASSRRQDFYQQHTHVGAKGGRAGQGAAHSNPIHVQKFLKSVDYPCSKEDLIAAAEHEGADQKVISTLHSMPGERFTSPKDVSKAIGDMK